MARTLRALAAGLAGTSLAFAGCASLGHGGADSCRSDLPRAAQSVGEVLDSAMLQSELEEIWTPTTGLVLAALRYDSLGGRDTAFVYSKSVPDSMRVRLVGSLMGHAAETGAAESRVSLFIGDEAGPALRRVERFAACQPKGLDRTWLTTQVQYAGRALGLTESRSAKVWTFVNMWGEVERVRIEEGSGDPDFDREVERIMNSARFQPAMIEGIPVPVWASFPVNYTVKRR